MFINIFFGYLCGSFPSGVIVSKLFGLSDPRVSGSKSTGATNVLRTSGKYAAATVFIMDFLKGFIPVIMFSDDIYAIALACIMGHIFPVWTKFKGGKGVATFFGASMAISWLYTLISCALWLSLYKKWRMVSLASIFSILFSGICLFLDAKSIDKIYILLTFTIVIYAHRSNIIRIRKGEEPKTF